MRLVILKDAGRRTRKLVTVEMIYSYVSVDPRWVSVRMRLFNGYHSTGHHMLAYPIL